MKRVLPFVAAFVVLVVGAVTLGALDRAWTDEIRAQQRSRVEEQLGIVHRTIEAQLETQIAVTMGLVALVAHEPELDQAAFERAAKLVLDPVEGIRSVGLARHSSVSHL